VDHGVATVSYHLEEVEIGVFSRERE
jgi:hypothetical protein